MYTKQKTAAASLLLAGSIAALASLAAQTPTTTPTQPPTGNPGSPPSAVAAPRGPGVAARPAAYPSRPPADPAVVERGRALYGVNCNFCHGSDARGGEGGPNLLRSELVLNDKNGELIAPVVINGRVDQGMPKFPMTMAQISDMAAYIHSFKVGGYDISRNVPPSILVGDAAAGQKAFASKCSSCHSVTGDLKGIASRISDPKILQNNWVMPGGGFRRPGGGGGPVNVPPTTVSVTLPGGEKVDGRLGRIDDFVVTLISKEGLERTFRRDGDTPKVEVHDPLQPHKDLLPTYTDQEVHNLTSYLVTVK